MIDTASHDSLFAILTKFARYELACCVRMWREQEGKGRSRAKNFWGLFIDLLPAGVDKICVCFYIEHSKDTRNPLDLFLCLYF